MIWFHFAWTRLTTRCFLLRTAFTRLLILNQLGVGSPCSLPIGKYRVSAGCSGHRILQSCYNYYVDIRLCFGLSCAPSIFNRLSNAIVRMMARCGFHAVMIYVNNFLIIRSTQAERQMRLVTLIRLLHSLGINVSWRKVASMVLELSLLTTGLLALGRLPPRTPPTHAYFHLTGVLLVTLLTRHYAEISISWSFSRFLSPPGTGVLFGQTNVFAKKLITLKHCRSLTKALVKVP